MTDEPIHDAPQGWERLERALKSLPRRSAPQERLDAIRLQVVKRTIFGIRQSPLLAGMGGLVLAAVVILAFIGVGTGDRLLPDHLLTPMPIVKEIPMRHRAAPRASLRRLPSPAAMETGVDTAIPRNPTGYSGHHPAIPPMPSAATGR